MLQDLGGVNCAAMRIIIMVNLIYNALFIRDLRVLQGKSNKLKA